LAVLRGEKDKVKGGSGRVLSSTANDRVFVSHEGHGSSGSLSVAGSSMTVKELNEALVEANRKKLFKELTYYVMACLSGSMFSGKLDANGNIYALTAASPELNARARDQLVGTIDGEEKSIYINTQFGYAWILDVEKNDTSKQTLKEQCKIVAPQVSSNASQYGNLNIANEIVSNFEGANGKKTRVELKSFDKKDLGHSIDSIPISPIASYLLLKQKLKNSNSFEGQGELSRQLNEMEKEQREINKKVNAIVDSFTINGTPKFVLLRRDIQKPPQMITEVDCHHVVVKTIDRLCKKITKSPFVYEFTTPMVNLCEHKFDAQKIVEQIKKQCGN